MTKKSDAISDELNLNLTTARLLERHLREHGRPKTMVEDAAELAALLKPYNEAQEAAEAADAGKEAKRHG